MTNSLKILFFCLTVSFCLILAPRTIASHHNDSMTAEKDGRLNITDMYVFPNNNKESTVFIMNVGKDAGGEGPKYFHSESVYDFNIDENRDGIADSLYRFRFDVPDAQSHQGYSLSKLEKQEFDGANELLLASTDTLEKTISLNDGGKVWIGLAGDPFAANAEAYFAFMDSVGAGKADFSVFDSPANYFAEFNVLSIVLEIPNTAFKKKEIDLWTSIVATPKDAPNEIFQVSRFAHPLIAFIFSSTPEDAELMNVGLPSNDMAQQYEKASQRIAMISQAAESVTDSKAYGQKLANTFIPIVLPYTIGTPASYSLGYINGRALQDDVFDVVLSLVSNRPINDGIYPGSTKRDDFPYVPSPKTTAKLPTK